MTAPDPAPLQPSAPWRRYGARFALRVLAVVLVLAVIWLPHILHFHIDRSPPSAEITSTLSSTPDDARLDEIASITLAVSLDISPREIVPTARAILDGRLSAPEFLDRPIALSDYPDDFSRGSPTFQLVMASLETERILLKAYANTTLDAYLKRALERSVAFAHYEAQVRDANGFLWNDHAVAARVSVLVQLWRHIRTRTDVSDASKRAIVELALRSARLLSKPDHFTVRTNHGVMQNLALLQLTAAFPAFRETAKWRQLALERLMLQLGFYVSDEGVVLEHSAEYHELGNQLLHFALRLVDLNGLVVPARLEAAASHTQRFLTVLRRPDGSLPLIGNTKALTRRKAHAPTSGAESGDTAPALFPLSGYAVWRDTGTQDQTRGQVAIAWAKHDRHGHKHADEMSWHWWNGGTDWITASGYWPYGAAGFNAANGWRGSNAPHLPGEPGNSARRVTLLASASTPTLRFLALQRTGPGALVLDRQFVQLSPDQILVVDFATGAEHGIETLWTASPDLSFRKTDATTVESSADMRGRHLKIQTAGDPTPELRIARGETVPFSGWVVVHRHPRSAPWLEAFQPGPESVKATLFTLQQKGTAENSATPTIAPGARPEAWSLTLDSGNSTHLRLTRQGRSLVLEDTANGSQNTVPLDTPAPLASRQAALRTAMTDAIAQYPQWRNLKHYRIKMTYLVLALFALLEIAYLIVNWRTGGWRPTKAIHITIVAGWTCAALWMHGVYFGG